MSVCNRSHARMLDELIAVKQQFLRGVPLFDALVRGDSPHPSAGNLLTETRDSTLSYGKNSEVSISSWLESVPGRDRRTDRIAIANTH